MKRLAKALFVAAAFALALSTAPKASAENNIKAGYLSCHVASGFGIIFGSSRELKCTYTPVSGPAEEYTGEISKFGADIGYLHSGVILWEVLAPANTEVGAIAGHYAGGTASATVGLGVGAHALFGGMHGSIALQPVAIEGNNGLNVAAGVETVNLEYVLPKK